MKAIVYTKYGPPSVLKLKEVDKPVPKDDEVLIKVHAAEATKSDCELRSFNFPVKWFWLPLRVAMGIIKPKRKILGGYFAGEIVSIGRNVSKFTEGNLVFGAARLRMGAYGEYVSLPDSYTIVPKPGNISFEEAMDTLKDAKEEMVSVPFVSIKSISSNHNYKLFIDKVEKEEEEVGAFSTYGLSSTSTVPYTSFN